MPGFNLRQAQVGIRTRNVLSDLLHERCRRSPVVMFVEDLHWADTASQDWLSRIAESDRDLPLLIVAAFRPHYRPPWADLPGVTTLILERLSDESTVELLQKRIAENHVGKVQTIDGCTLAIAPGRGWIFCALPAAGRNIGRTVDAATA